MTKALQDTSAHDMTPEKGEKRRQRCLMMLRANLTVRGGKPTPQHLPIPDEHPIASLGYRDLEKDEFDTS